MVAASWVAALSVIVARPAHAAPGAVAVLAPPSLAPALAGPLGQAMGQAVTTAKLTLVGSAELDTALQGESALRGCTTPTCMERLGRLVGASAVLRFTATAEKTGSSKATYQFQVDYYNVEVGAQGASQSSTCASCSISEAAQSLRELARQVITADAARPRGTLSIDTTPPSATVFVDGNESGLTPYQRTTFVGSHTVVLRATGFVSQETTISVADQRTTRLDVRLLPGSNNLTAGGEDNKPVYKKWWFWTIIGGVAVAAAVATTAAVVVSQSGVVTEPPHSMFHINF